MSNCRKRNNIPRSKNNENADYEFAKKLQVCTNFTTGTRSKNNIFWFISTELTFNRLNFYILLHIYALSETIPWVFFSKSRKTKIDRDAILI